jgi:tripartite-type tricarboxylate transporter receptor subunit TctC
MAFQTTRRAALRALGVAGLAAATGTRLAQAQVEGGRPVRIVVNFPPGGPLDILARLLATHMAVRLKQPYIVENVSGAAGAIGATNVARAAADGQTLLLSIDAPFTTSAALNPKAAPRFESFTPVMALARTSLALAVHPSLGVKTLPDFIALGKRGPINFSTAGIGSPGHFAALMLAEATGIQVHPIAYRGNAPATAALLAGEVQAGCLAVSGLMPHLSSGRLQGLAVAGQGSALLPDLPTTVQAGYPGVTLDSHFVAMAPPQTPDAVVKVWQSAITEVLRRPDVVRQLRDMDITVQPTDASGGLALLERLRGEYQRVVLATGMKPE